MTLSESRLDTDSRRSINDIIEYRIEARSTAKSNQLAQPNEVQHSLIAEEVPHFYCSLLINSAFSTFLTKAKTLV